MTETNRQEDKHRTGSNRRLKVPVVGKSPERGAKVLFFSGGTALRELSRTLIGYTHHSIHIITPFDSGGSSAQLRKAFHMPAVGDIRNRLTALIDLAESGNAEMQQLFSHRLPKEADHRLLYNEVVQMAEGRHLLVRQVLEPARRAVRRHLAGFLDIMPETFDLRGASIGNIVIAAGYLMNGRDFEPVLSFLSDLAHVRGTVRPVINGHLQLAAILENGKTLLGQDRITGKQCAPIKERITRVFLTGQNGEPAEAAIGSDTRRLIARAELICYPMGSFYSSLIANLLPEGIGTAIAATKCPKIYVPSTGSDPEAWGLDTADQVDILLQYLKADAPHRIRTDQVLDLIVLDSDAKIEKKTEERIRDRGVRILRHELITRESAPHIDSTRLTQLLLAMT